MKKTRRTKTVAVAVPSTRQEAERLLGEIGHLQRQVTKVETDMNDVLTSIKEKYERQAQPINEKIENLFQALHMWASARRAELLKGKSKTVRLSTGELMWRNTPPSVSTPRGKKLELLIDLLVSGGRPDLLRVKHEINKEAILDDPSLIEQIRSLKIVSREEFVAKPFESEIERVEVVARNVSENSRASS